MLHTSLQMRSSLLLRLLVMVNIAWGGETLHKFFSSTQFATRSSLLSKHPQVEPFIVKLKESPTYLMNKRVLSKALHKLSLPSLNNDSTASLAPFTAGDCKTVLVACVNTNDIELTDRLLELLDSRNLLTSDLLYVGIRYACKKKVSLIAYKLLLACSSYNVQTDIDTINEVISCLTINGNVEEAFDVLVRLGNRDFGKEVVGDVASYTQLIFYGGRSFKAQVSSILRALSLMEKNPAVTPENVVGSTPLGDNLFISALKICNFAGDYVSASEIFNIYQKYFGIVQVKAYNIFFLVYINGCKNKDRKNAELPVSSDEAKRKAYKFYLEKVAHIIDLNMDSSTILANSILRFHCASQDIEKAEEYFGRMKSLKHSLYASSIIDFSGLIRRQRHLQLAYEYYRYLSQLEYFPPPYLSIMAYEYELERKQLKSMVTLLNIDSFLQRDSTSIAKACLFATQMGHYEIARNIFTDIFLMHKSQNVEYSDRQFCFCLLAIIESALSHTPIDEFVDNTWIAELILPFIALDFKAYKVDPGKDDTDFLTIDYLGSSEKGPMQKMFSSHYFEILSTFEEDTSHVTTTKEKLTPSIWRLNDFIQTKGLDGKDEGILSLSWYRFRVAGYMIIAEALLARGETLLALDTLDLMLKDTRRQRKNVSVKVGTPSLLGVISADHVKTMFATFNEQHNGDKLYHGIKKRLVVNTSKNYELSKIRNCNVRNVDVNIQEMNFDEIQDIEEAREQISTMINTTFYRISNIIAASVAAVQENQNVADVTSDVVH